MSFDFSTWGTPGVRRERLETVRRNLVVKRVTTLTPKLLRITFSGELEGFASPSPDDHVKVFFPQGDGATAGRDYTPRRYDPAAEELDIEFVLHDGGLGSSWAGNAKPGDSLQIGGPRGATVVSAPGAWWLLIGDAAALPSISRRLEEAEEGTEVLVVAAVSSHEQELPFQTRAKVKTVWVHRGEEQSSDAGPVLAAFAELTLPEGPGFVWIGAEEEVARAVRAHFVEERGHPEAWIKASAYWKKG